MSWRISLAVTIAVSWLLYSFLPLKSDFLRFAMAGLAFAVLTRVLPVAIDSIASAKLLVVYRLRHNLSQANNAEKTRRESELVVAGAGKQVMKNE